VIRRVVCVCSVVVVVAACTAYGVACLGHPFFAWGYGAAHKSPSSPLIGVGLLAMPAILIGFGGYRLWNAISLSLEARRLRRGRPV
jgi:hypothetical protein